METSIGYLYVLSNEYSPGILKIGYTTKSVEERALELYTTGVPAKFLIEYKVKVVNPHAWESKVHDALKDKRVNKEWFKLSSAEAIAIINQVVSADAVQLVNTYEINDIKALIKEVAETSFDLYLKNNLVLLKEIPEIYALLVDYFYDKFEKDLLNKSGFFSQFNGRSKIIKEKVCVFKSASLYAIKNIIINGDFSKEKYHLMLLEMCSSNLSKARRMHADALTKKNSVEPQYIKNELYKSLVGKLELLEYLVSINRFGNVSQAVNLNSIKDPVLIHLTLCLKQDRKLLYDFDVLKNHFPKI